MTPTGIHTPTARKAAVKAREKELPEAMAAIDPSGDRIASIAAGRQTGQAASTIVRRETS